MDMFGIGSAITAVVDSYFHGARSTGRTTRLLESLKAGDRIVTLDEPQARVLRSLLTRRKLAVSVLVLPVRDPILPGIARSEGKTVFDHTWVEEFYRLELRRANSSLRYIEEHLSRTELAETAYPDYWKRK
jgi:hypothetical protein